MIRMVSILSVMIILSGCAIGYMKHTEFDSPRNAFLETTYSPAFVTEKTLLCEGISSDLLIENTRRVEPITYSLRKCMGWLGPQDLMSKGRAMIRLYNSSTETFTVSLDALYIQSDYYAIRLEPITLAPGERFCTPYVRVTIPTYERDFSVRIHGKTFPGEFTRELVMRRITKSAYKQLQKETVVCL